jgi:YcaO-like protein with predicted kinase domain
MLSTKECRAESAAYLNRLSRDELFERFLVTRMARIDGLDCIGVPVYSSVRPASRSISVNSGKSQCPSMARAGAIAEAIEFHTFEQHPKWFKEGPVGLDLPFPTHKNSEWTPATSVILETVTHWKTAETVRFPAELVWMTRRADQNHFMRSTTGQAVASSFPEALLAGIYEVVERDQATLTRTNLVRRGVYPRRVAIPESLRPLGAKISQADLRVYLLGCTQDINIPVFWCLLIDPHGCAGAYMGYGCNIDVTIAAERAILEAVQGRCVYISGARDDILRRDFLKQRAVDPKVFMAELDPLPVHPFVDDWSNFEMTPEQELTRVLGRIQKWHDSIYFKAIDLGDMWAVKTIILGMECPSICEEEIWRSMRSLE